MIIRNARYKQVLPGVVGYKGNLYTKAYAKGELLFDYTDDEYETQYFTTESLEDGNVITFTIGSNVTTSDLTSISYSTDGGLTWTTTQNTDSTTQTINVNLDAGDKVLWKGSGTALGAGYEETVANVSRFSSTKKYSVYGNIMSLLYSDNFSDKTNVTDDYAFCGLFYQSTNLVDAENLVIPIKTINRLRTFVGTFRGCTSLATNPKFSPETISAQHGCMRMFRDCTSLEKTVDLSNLTTITGASACIEMYRGCTSLREVDKLPATSLYDYCYQSMFYGCTSLTTAPELPAPTLVMNCYRQMFYGCTSLNCIKCLATDISASNCTENWVYNVAPTGDFVKDPSMNDWLIDNVNGIPIGWTLHGVATYTVTLTVNDADMGVADGAGTYSAGDQVVLRADAFTGYSFVGWYDGSTLVSSDTTYVFNIYSNISYEARFAQGGHNYANDYLTIEATEEDNTKIVFRIPPEFAGNSTYMTSISFSLDGGTTWETNNLSSLTGGQAHKYSKTINLGQKLLVKGIGTTLSSWVGTSVSIYANKKWKVSGNIMSLIYGDNFANQTSLGTCMMRQLFTNYTKSDYGDSLGIGYADSFLVDAGDLILPATSLPSTSGYSDGTADGYGCYYEMFSECAHLLKAPTLPATTLGNGCYNGMFLNCTSLPDAPQLSSTSLAKYCYGRMFAGCTSLINAPTLPATTLADYCYVSMFSRCTSLTTAPALPATTLTYWCYLNMFGNCTSLTTAPSLPATTLAESCYEKMFQGCTSLVNVPNELPALKLPESCCYRMFYECSNLAQAPKLNGRSLGQYCYNSMFKGTKIQNLKVYAVSSSYSIDFGEINYSNGIYYVYRNATSNILNACPTGWTISKTL